VQPVEELAWGQRRLEEDGPVEEARLLGDRPDRVGFAQRRYGHDLYPRGRRQTIDRST
jgi:hypothetical protein